MKAFYLLCLMLFSFTTSQAGPWPRVKGELYLKLNQWWVIFDEYYDQDKNIESLPRTRSIGSTSIYAEYGISGRFTTIVYFPFFSKATLYELKDINSGTLVKEGDAVSSVGDTDITILYSLIKDKPVVLSASLTFGLPFGIERGGKDGSLQTGDGEFNQMLKMEAGGTVKVGKLYPYFILFMGINNRTQNFSDELRYGAEAGVNRGFITLIMRTYGVKSFFNGSANESLFSKVPAANNTEYLIVAPELAINFSQKAGVSFSYFKALSGRFYFSNPSYSLGIFLKL